jgi:hypothetical protein
MRPSTEKPMAAYASRGTEVRPGDAPSAALAGAAAVPMPAARRRERAGAEGSGTSLPDPSRRGDRPAEHRPRSDPVPPGRAASRRRPHPVAPLRAGEGAPPCGVTADRGSDQPPLEGQEYLFKIRRVERRRIRPETDSGCLGHTPAHRSRAFRSTGRRVWGVLGNGWDAMARPMSCCALSARARISMRGATGPQVFEIPVADHRSSRP